VRWLIVFVAGCGFGKTINLSSIDLAGGDLASADFAGVDFAGVDFAGVDFAVPDLSSTADLSQPTGSRVVFTTHFTWTGILDGTPGLLEADFLCQNAAIAGGFGNRTFRAWLSDDSMAATDRILGTGPWFRRDGPKAFAGRPDQLPLVPLNTDEDGLLLPSGSHVWTGTLSTGRAVTGQNCNGWGSGSGSLTGEIGNADAQLGTWTDAGTQTCDIPSHLYCFETG
jgi:hypothetical protein